MFVCFESGSGYRSPSSRVTNPPLPLSPPAACTENVFKAKNEEHEKLKNRVGGYVRFRGRVRRGRAFPPPRLPIRTGAGSREWSSLRPSIPPLV